MTRRRWASALVGLSVLAASCTAGERADNEPTASAPATTTAPDGRGDLPVGPEGDAFYEPPDPLPEGEPGELIWAREVDAPVGAVGWRVLYYSRSLGGDDIAVSGLVFAPEGDAGTADSERPLLAYAHGSTGLGDKCAPSRREGSGSMELTEARVAAAPYLSRGFVVAATDYEGLGTPGGHPYVVGLSEARSLLDSVRAAQQLSGASAGDRVIVTGFSQGGGAALIAGELAPTYAPELEVLGVAAGAPVSELRSLATSHTSTFFGYVAMGTAGFHAAYPDLSLDAVLAPDAIAELREIEGLCLAEILDRYRGLDPNQLFTRDPGSVEPWSSRLEENSPGVRPAGSPVFMFHGLADEQVPVVDSERVLDRYCRLGGADVELRVYEDATHGGVLTAAGADMLAFVDARLAGKPAASSCPDG